MATTRVGRILVMICFLMMACGEVRPADPSDGDLIGRWGAESDNIDDCAVSLTYASHFSMGLRTSSTGDRQGFAILGNHTDQSMPLELTVESLGDTNPDMELTMEAHEWDGAEELGFGEFFGYVDEDVRVHLNGQFKRPGREAKPYHSLLTLSWKKWTPLPRPTSIEASIRWGDYVISADMRIVARNLDIIGVNGTRVDGVRVRCGNKQPKE